MSDTTWPRFEVEKYSRGVGYPALWKVVAVSADPKWLVMRSGIAGHLTEPEARAMAAALNLAREAREYTEAHEAVIAHHAEFGVCESRELLTRLDNARTAFRAKAKETQ